MDASGVNLLLALSDLKLVQSVIGAINANLPKTGPLGTIPPGANPATPRPGLKLQQHKNPEPGPRLGAHPQPRFEPRPVIHPQPRVVEPPPVAPPGPIPVEGTRSTSPLQPPWKTIPWPQRVPVELAVKVHVQQVDIIHKGSLLDLFV